MVTLPEGAAENFMKALGSFGKAAGSTLQRSAPSILQGASQGASVGGPWGALIGAGAGLASGALSKPGAAPRPAPGPAAPAPAVTPIATASTPPALPTGQGAAATLLGLFQNPAVRQSLLSQVLGSAGGDQVPTASGASLPRGAINNLLTMLLANATEDLPESESISEQRYLMDESGEYLVDPASPEQQAALVLSHLQTGGSEAAEWAGDSLEWAGDSVDDFESDESSETVEFY